MFLSLGLLDDFLMIKLDYGYMGRKLERKCFLATEYQGLHDVRDLQLVMSISSLG